MKLGEQKHPEEMGIAFDVPGLHIRSRLVKDFDQLGDHQSAMLPRFFNGRNRQFSSLTVEIDNNTDCAGPTTFA